jgi:hypothetical protein
MDHVLLVTVQGRPWREARAHASPVTATRQEFGPAAPSGEREREDDRCMRVLRLVGTVAGLCFGLTRARYLVVARGQTAKVVAAVIRKRYAARTRALL